MCSSECNNVACSKWEREGEDIWLTTRVSTTSWIYPFLLCIILFAKFISNFVISYYLYNCQGPGGWPSDRNAIARVTDDSIVGIMKGYTADDLSEAQTRLVGHDQSSNPPKNFDINTCCPESWMLHETWKSSGQDGDQGIRTLSNEETMWNDISLPYGRDPKYNQKLVFLQNHYRLLRRPVVWKKMHTALAITIRWVESFGSPV